MPAISAENLLLKITLPLLLVISIFFQASSEVKAYDFPGGAGTEESPYQIQTCDDLQGIGEEGDGHLDDYFILSNDIDCSGRGFLPIGTYAVPFTGNFDGNEHVISNLTINVPDAESDGFIGMFGACINCTITDVGLEDMDISSNAYSGALVGMAEGTIARCYTTGTVTSTGELGLAAGLIGGSQGNLNLHDCYSKADVTAVWVAGGISAGHVLTGEATMSNCYFAGTVNGGSVAAGLSGLMSDVDVDDTSMEVSNSFSAGLVSAGDDPDSVGAVIGTNEGQTHNNLYWYDRDDGLSCYGDGGTGSCTGKSSVSWFYDVANPPISSWDFDTPIWQPVVDGFPLLAWQDYQPPEESSDDNSSDDTDEPSAPTCSEPKPVGAPDLFQINVAGSEATLYYSPLNDHIDNYFISYSQNPGSFQHGVETGQSLSSGVLSFTVGCLPPNTTYYFRIRGQNGCMPGDWSQEMEVKTGWPGSSVSSFYRVQ